VVDAIGKRALALWEKTIRPVSMSTTIAASDVIVGGAARCSAKTGVILSLAIWVEAEADDTGPKGTAAQMTAAASRNHAVASDHETAVARPPFGGHFMAALSPSFLELQLW